MESNNNTQVGENKPKGRNNHKYRGKPHKAQAGNGKGPTTSTAGNQKVNKEIKQQVESSQESDDEAEELCFICTESIQIYAVSECDHRTCHRCSLRLRALYETRNCAYCKVSFCIVVNQNKHVANLPSMNKSRSKSRLFSLEMQKSHLQTIKASTFPLLMKHLTYRLKLRK
jgi:hypothetical protein